MRPNWLKQDLVPRLEQCQQGEPAPTQPPQQHPQHPQVPPHQPNGAPRRTQSLSKDEIRQQKQSQLNYQMEFPMLQKSSKSKNRQNQYQDQVNRLCKSNRAWQNQDRQNLDQASQDQQNLDQTSPSQDQKTPDQISQDQNYMDQVSQDLTNPDQSSQDQTNSNQTSKYQKNLDKISQDQKNPDQTRQYQKSLDQKSPSQTLKTPDQTCQDEKTPDQTRQDHHKPIQLSPYIQSAWPTIDKAEPYQPGQKKQAPFGQRQQDSEQNRVTLQSSGHKEAVTKPRQSMQPQKSIQSMQSKKSTQSTEPKMSMQSTQSNQTYHWSRHQSQNEQLIPPRVLNQPQKPVPYEMLSGNQLQLTSQDEQLCRNQLKQQYGVEKSKQLPQSDHGSTRNQPVRMLQRHGPPRTQLNLHQSTQQLQVSKRQSPTDHLPAPQELKQQISNQDEVMPLSTGGEHAEKFINYIINQMDDNQKEELQERASQLLQKLSQDELNQLNHQWQGIFAGQAAGLQLHNEQPITIQNTQPDMPKTACRAPGHILQDPRTHFDTAAASTCAELNGRLLLQPRCGALQDYGPARQPNDRLKPSQATDWFSAGPWDNDWLQTSQNFPHTTQSRDRLTHEGCDRLLPEIQARRQNQEVKSTNIEHKLRMAYAQTQHQSHEEKNNKLIGDSVAQAYVNFTQEPNQQNTRGSRSDIDKDRYNLLVGITLQQYRYEPLLLPDACSFTGPLTGQSRLPVFQQLREKGETEAQAR